MSESNDETIKAMFFSTEGRLNRLRYFKRTLVISILSIFIDVLFSNDDGSDTAFTFLIGMLFLVPTYCLDVRRLKDLDKDATLAILNLVFGIIMSIFEPSSISMKLLEQGIITRDTAFNVCIVLSQIAISIFLTFFSGTRGRNRYGEDPLGRIETSAESFVANMESSEESQTNIPDWVSENVVLGALLSLGYVLHRHSRYDWWMAILIFLTVAGVIFVVAMLSLKQKKS